MPDVIAKFHDNFIYRLVDSGIPTIVRRYRVAPAKDKQGFLFPLNIYVTYFWHILDDFCFSGLLIKLKTSAMFLLLDQ